MYGPIRMYMTHFLGVLVDTLKVKDAGLVREANRCPKPSFGKVQGGYLSHSPLVTGREHPLR